MATVKHFVICVPRQNRAEPPVAPEDSGVWRFLTEKTYLRKYFKVFCVSYTSLDPVMSFVRMTFKNGVFVKDVSRSVLSNLDITPMPYAEFVDYCNSSIVRDNLDRELPGISTAELSPVYIVPSVLNLAPSKYRDSLFTRLCDCFSFGWFFDYESFVYATPNGVCIINPEEYSAHYQIPSDCFIDKEYKDGPIDTINRYIADCHNLCLFSLGDTVVVDEEDIPDDDDFNACYAMYKETV